jgi:hypothetical protein
MTAGEAIEARLARLRARQATPTYLAGLRARRAAAECARERALTRGDRALAAGLAAVVRGYERWLAEPAPAPAPPARPGRRLLRERRPRHDAAG